MSDLLTAARQALDALEDAMYRADTHEFYNAKESLRQAIQQAEQQEPAGYVDPKYALEMQQKRLPHTWLHAQQDAEASLAVYTTPPQRKPLTGWQPIETAPKTGKKVVLFYLNRNNLPRTVMARWLTDEQAAETDADDVGLEGGWYECIDNWNDYTEVAIHEGEPSHWMPLPAPPIERAHGIGGGE